MNQKIREHMNGLFQEAPKTKKALELKEEMIANAEEKFSDLLAEGYQEEDAFAVVANSIGNVEELFRELEKEEESAAALSAWGLETRKKKAKYTSVAVGLYMCAVAVWFGCVIFSEYWGLESLASFGFLIGLLLCIAPTMLLTYVSGLTSKYDKKEDSMVEEYKEWRNEKAQSKEIRKAVSSVIWTLALIGYFVISFATMAWYATWIIFLIAACAEAVISLVSSLKK